MSKIVKVPVLPHVHKMMLTFYGINGVISFDADSYVGALMKLALEKIDFNLKPKTVPEGFIYLKFKLPKKFADMDLSDQTALNLGMFLNEDFKQSGAFYYLGMINTIKNTQSITTSYLRQANCNDLIELDSAKKMIFRRCTSLQDHKRKNKRKENIKNFLPVSDVKIPN
jgi:hypothetical protein